MVAPGQQLGTTTLQAEVVALVSAARRSGVPDADLLALVHGALLQVPRR